MTSSKLNSIKKLTKPSFILINLFLLLSMDRLSHLLFRASSKLKQTNKLFEAFSQHQSILIRTQTSPICLFYNPLFTFASRFQIHINLVSVSQRLQIAPHRQRRHH